MSIVYKTMKYSLTHFVYTLSLSFGIVGITNAQKLINNQVNLGYGSDTGTRSDISSSILANTFSFEPNDNFINDPQFFIQGFRKEEDKKLDSSLFQDLNALDMEAENKVDLSVEIHSNEGRLFEGEEFDYYLTITNKGDGGVFEVTMFNVLLDKIPYIIQHVEWSSDRDGISSTINNGKIEWSIPVLLSKSSLEIKVNAKLGTLGGDYPRKIINRVEVFSDGFENNPEDNIFIETREVSPIKIPNVLDARGNGEKEKFQIQGLKFFESNELFVFNTFSDLVFFAENYDNNWDIKHIGSGLYYYIFAGTDHFGEYHELSGRLNIIK